MSTATCYTQDTHYAYSVFYTLPLGILIKLYDTSLYSKKVRLRKLQFAYNNTNPGLADTKVPAGFLLWQLIFFTERSNTFKELKHLSIGKEYRSLDCHPQKGQLARLASVGV